MNYFAIDNLTSTPVRTFSDPAVENVSAKANEPQGMVDKETRRKWLADPSSKATLFSTWEGLTSTERINTKKGNPPWKLHGIVVDYDAPSPASLAAIQSNVAQILKATPLLLPQWGVISPSGNHRLVWEFDQPFNVGEAPDSFINELLSEIKKLLKLPMLLAGFDEAVFRKPATFFDIGGTWQRFNTNTLPVDEIQGCFVSAVKKVSRGKTTTGLPEIPMDLVFEEINRQFPGRWPKGTEFKDNVMGPAVWDPDAKSNRSTVYRPWGAYCFSAEDKLFRPYSEILGRDFTRKWEANKIGAATESIYYVPSLGYYRKWPDGHWRRQPKEDLSLYLAGAQGLSRAKGAASSASEVESALLHIQQSRVLDGAVPFVYDPREVVDMAGQKLLNVSRVTLMEPDSSIASPVWAQGFPWIAGWLGSMFDPRKQLVYFLAWLKLFYEGARRGNLQRGHAVFMVGTTNRGKTLLNAVWIPMIMGGGADASAYLVRGEMFNKNLLEVAHWHVDDSTAASDRATHTKFSERVKALIANPKLGYRPMYTDTQMVPYNGRLLVTLNNDPGSLLMIPDLDRNIEDKLIVLGLDEKSHWSFQGNAHTERTLKNETPAFLQWLINWAPPKFVVNPHHRWGMRNYVHPVVKSTATLHSFDADLLGVLEILWNSDDEWVGLASRDEPWEGTAADLTQIISSHNNLTKLMAGMTVRSVGMRLSKLSKISGTGVSVCRIGSKHKGSSTKYAITPIHQN